MKNKRILLVEDDLDDQLIFTDAIAELDVDLECVVANNGFEAFNQLNTMEAAPSIIFLDLNMPVMNGFEFLENMNNLNHLKDIPVVIFSTSSSPVDQKRSTELGAKMFFTKTPDFRFLKKKLQELLETDFTA